MARQNLGGHKLSHLGHHVMKICHDNSIKIGHILVAEQTLKCGWVLEGVRVRVLSEASPGCNTCLEF
jgi:hypothetical protein